MQVNGKLVSVQQPTARLGLKLFSLLQDESRETELDSLYCEALAMCVVDAETKEPVYSLEEADKFLDMDLSDFMSLVKQVNAMLKPIHTEEEADAAKKS